AADTIERGFGQPDYFVVITTSLILRFDDRGVRISDRTSPVLTTIDDCKPEVFIIAPQNTVSSATERAAAGARAMHNLDATHACPHALGRAAAAGGLRRADSLRVLQRRHASTGQHYESGKRPRSSRLD